MKRVDLLTQLKSVVGEAENWRRENPSRYTGDGYLKPLCEPDQHKPFGKSIRCEICGLVVRGAGANLPLASGEH